jgi:hypothetical protein
MPELPNRGLEFAREIKRIMKKTMEAMKILDLDLDCFIEGIVHYSSDEGDRPDNKEYPCWHEEDFRDFLENQCGLKKNRRIQGTTVTRHVETFQLWRKMIESGELRIPFEVIHVDAHSDMGIGEKSVYYMLHELLLKPCHHRMETGEYIKYLSSGNYLAFALSFGWINKLTFVHHIDYDNNDDFVLQYFKGYNPDNGYVQMKGYDKLRSECEYYNDIAPILTDPDIPFVLCPVNEFTASDSFNFATICQSPGFTPSSADLLIDLFRDYIIDS